MKSILTTLILGSILLLASCVKEELSGYGNAPEGEPALVSLKMNMALMDSGPESRAMTPDQESEITGIRVMIFDKNGHIVTNKKFTGNSTSLSVETYSGNNRSIYVVANAVPALDERLKRIATLAQLKEAKTTYTELDLGSDNALMMNGSVEGVNIRSGTGGLTIPIQLDFLVAKLTLKVVDATNASEKVTFLGWSMADVPMNTFIYQGSGDKDANHGLDNTESAWLSTNMFPFEDDSLQVYLTENRRGGRVERTPPSEANRYPGMNVNDGDHRGKMWYKPARATAIVIHAQHQTATETETKQVAMRIYLGNDNHSNYDVVRGSHYKFTVTVNGLAKINVDSNVEPIIPVCKVDHGTNLIMDAHPDYRPFRISAPKGKATIEIVDEAGRTCDDRRNFSATWLKISPLDLMRHQVKQAAPNDHWQQKAGKPGGFVRAKYIPHHSVRTTLAGKGGWNGVPAGKENDDVMAFNDATYRMCYKITDIPFNSPTSTEQKILCVYADEYLNDGGERKANVRITYYKEGLNLAPEVKTFTISQQGYLSLYTTPDAGLVALNGGGGIPDNGIKKRFVIERTEEVDLLLNPDITSGVQMTNSMRWGFGGVELYNKPDKYRNGTLLTAHAVYTDVNRTANNEPAGFGTAENSYRDMYGNGKSGGYGVIPNYGNGTHSGAPYYYPNATANVYHPIYKSSAARYCHEKNRDMNGDGYIDASETKWYLPSQHELLMIYVAGKYVSGKQEGFLFGVNYWSATEGNISTVWQTYFTNGTGMGPYDKNDNRFRVRCIRDITPVMP